MVEASTNLLNWLPVHTNLIGDVGECLFYDLHTGQYPRRSYRAILYEGELSPPAMLISGAGVVGAQFQVAVGAVGGQEVVVEASTNLVDWTPILTNTAAIGPRCFHDIDMTNFTIRSRAISIQYSAFRDCSNLVEVYCEGCAPSVGSSAFSGAASAIVYHLPGSTRWEETFGGRPTVLWLPQMLTGDPSFGVQEGRFGFTISWASDRVVVVKANGELSTHVWTPVSTNTLTGGMSHFSESDWTNYPTRFYRLRSP